MNAEAVILQTRQLGINLRVEGDKLKYAPMSAMPSELLNALREHKGEVIAQLARPNIAEGSPDWHGREIARRVEEEGICLFWSDAYSEMIAFVRDESYRAKVPLGTVTYSSREVYELCLKNPSPETRRLIHEAKKRGGVIS